MLFLRCGCCSLDGGILVVVVVLGGCPHDSQDDDEVIGGSCSHDDAAAICGCCSRVYARDCSLGGLVVCGRSLGGAVVIVGAVIAGDGGGDGDSGGEGGLKLSSLLAKVFRGIAAATISAASDGLGSLFLSLLLLVFRAAAAGAASSVPNAGHPVSAPADDPSLVPSSSAARSAARFDASGRRCPRQDKRVAALRPFFCLFSGEDIGDALADPNLGRLVVLLGLFPPPSLKSIALVHDAVISPPPLQDDDTDIIVLLE
mmetsp:Transcript_16537/g.24461  ORF Transcript_16537/g.24461 Transcript_16537/m.24461 type:complete len:258 (+) Transcript_16537:889-1662(+)